MAFRAMTVLRLGPGFGNRVVWGKGQLPTVTNWGLMAESRAFDDADRHAVLLDISEPTALERADGNWAAVLPSIANGPGRSLDERAADFDRHILPARHKPRTRGKNWSYWAFVVTWGVTNDAVRLLLPMSVKTLKALSWDCLMLGCSRSVIESVWSAVQHRHNILGLDPPLVGRNVFTSWVKAISCLMGRPLRLKFPIHKGIVAFLLRWHPESMALNRDRLLTALATITCLRVSEVARLQVCDLWFHYFESMGLLGFEGTAAIHIVNRKNDTQRKGHHPAVGKSRDPSLDIIHQLKTWLRLTGMCVHPSCTKLSNPAARCSFCPPLFPRTRNGPGNVTYVTMEPCSPQMISDAIKRMAKQAGADPARYSGVSARKGGLSTAVQAGVEEVILHLQSGHGLPRAARTYMHLQDPRRLFETFEAFGL